MDISLNPKLDQWIKEKVESGFYNSASEVILEGLRLLKYQDEQRQLMTEDLRQELLIGINQLDSGKSVPFESSVVSEIKNKGRSKLF